MLQFKTIEWDVRETKIYEFRWKRKVRGKNVIKFSELRWTAIRRSSQEVHENALCSLCGTGAFSLGNLGATSPVQATEKQTALQRRCASDFISITSNHGRKASFQHVLGKKRFFGNRAREGWRRNMRQKNNHWFCDFTREFC